MCACGRCTVEDWMEGRPCLRKRKDFFPELILVQRNSPKLSTLVNPTIDVNITLVAQTKDIIDRFNSCYSLTIEKLQREVNGYWYARKGRISLAIEKIVQFLQNRLGLTVPQEIVNVNQLSNYLKHILRVSWFNFKPIALISKEYLNKLYPELLKKWMEYFNHFQKYCNERKLKECVGMLFNSKAKSDNIFILQVDKKYYDMRLTDISCLCDSLCYVLDCNELSVHLLTALPGSLQLYFCYCSEDYFTTFHHLTNEQLLCLADLMMCKILSLRDYRNHFVYSNIQNTVCLYFNVSGHIIIITFLFLRLHHT